MGLNINCSWIVLVLMLFLANNLWAIDIQLQFKKIGREQGLSHPRIKAIVQDHSGYIWIATKEGLNRYDGYDIKVYRHDVNNSESIPDNYVLSLLVDSQGRLWVGTLNGLSLYKPSSDSFVHFKPTTQESFLPNSKKPLRVFSLYEDAENNIVVGSGQEGVFQVELASTHLKRRYTKHADVFKQGKISAILELANGQMLFGTKYGLIVVDKNKRAVTHYRLTYPGGDDNRSNNIQALYAKNETEIFVGSTDGLHVFNISTKDYRTLTALKNNKNSLSNNTIKAIYPLSKEKIVIATKGGVDFFDIASETFKRNQHIESDSGSLSSNNTLSLFIDAFGLLWIGTMNSGVNIYTPDSAMFGLRKKTLNSAPCLSSNKHFNIIKTRAGNLWIDAYQKGLHKIDLTSENCKHYKMLSTLKPGLSENISAGSLFEDSRGDIWLGIVDGTAKRLRKGKVKFESFQIKNLKTIVEDNNGDLWMGTDGGGIYFFDYKKEIVKQFHHNPKNVNSISSNFVFSLAIENHSLWIASETGGLDHFDTATGEFTHYWYSAERKDGFKTGINSLLNDPQGYLWAGTMGMGLARLDKHTQTITYFTTKDGLPNNTIYKVLMDNQDILWLATHKGLARFDPESETTTNFYATDGLQGDEFNTGGFFDKTTNQLYFVGNQGFNAFNPLDIKLNTSKPLVVINDFLLFNRPANHLLTTGQDNKQKITLDYDQNLFTFSFSGLYFSDPTRHHYKFKMKGFDNEWRDTDYKHRTATYTNLDPGNYIFRVKASNHNGIWSDVKSVVLTIAPPLWLTWWAKVMYLILAIVIPVSLYLYRTKVLRKRTQLLEQQVQSRTQSLFQEKRRVEKLLNEKSKEFENISHEFRTPLAIIMGRAKQRLADTPSSEEQTTLEVIEKVTQRLALTVDDVIEMGRANHFQEVDKHQLISISNLVTEICEQMAAFASIEGLNFEFAISSQIYQSCLPNALEKLFNNLISNAIKYTPEGGSISITLSENGPTNYQFIIKDSGIGIPKDQQPYVFERFFRCNDKNALHVQGTGIGLSLVKEVVDAHHGKIELFSEVNKGTQFTLHMPMIREPNEVNDYNISTEQLSVMMDISKSDNNKEASKTVQDVNDNKSKLLLLEDNVEMRLLLQEQLSKNYSVTSAINGAEGIKLALRDIPEVIVSDINMPIMDGYAFLQAVKSDPATSHIPVILLTAKSDAESRITGFRYKADGYIAKPYAQEELLALIETQQHNRQKVREHAAKSLQSGQSLSIPGMDQHSNDALSKCMTFVKKHYQNSELNVKALAEAACLSDRHLLRKFQDTLGMSPSEFLNDYRLQCAQTLLRKGLKVNDVANRVGFHSASYMARRYKKKYGIPPSQEPTSTEPPDMSTNPPNG